MAKSDGSGGQADEHGWTTAGKIKNKNASISRKPAGELNRYARGEAELQFTGLSTLLGTEVVVHGVATDLLY